MDERPIRIWLEPGYDHARLGFEPARDALKLMLDARDGVQEFYERLGFEPARTVLVRPRRE